MFAPELNDTKNQLTSLFNEINAVSGYSTSVQDTFIGKIPKEPDWIPAVRTEMQLLSKAGQNWADNYPSHWADVLTPFYNYSTSFAAFSDEIKKNLKVLTKSQIIALLSNLSASLQDCTTTTKKGLDNLSSFENQFTIVFPSINKSIQSGWNELKEEEQEMIEIAEAITRFQDEISSLQSKIDGSVISGGKTFVQTNVKIAYDILSATGEVAVPYLSFVTIAYTIGKTFYDIISDTNKINEDLEKIGALQVQASEEAQAMALTKATIQYLYNIELQFQSIKTHGNGLATMWGNEKSKIDAAINAIDAGAEPSKFFDILTMDVANQNWQALLGFAKDILNIQRTYGPNVILKTTKTK